MRILAFSSLFGQFTPMALSKMKPRTREKSKNFKEFPCLTFIQIGIGELAPNFFNDLDVIEVR
jgi:hypothetical protein